MRVSMEYFMKRRNLGWSSFQGLEYPRYEAWCHVRHVIPVSEEEFMQKVTTIPEPVSEEKTLPPNPEHLDAKLLNKRKKAELVELASMYGVDLNGSETKKRIIPLIIEACENA